MFVFFFFFGWLVGWIWEWDACNGQLMFNHKVENNSYFRWKMYAYLFLFWSVKLLTSSEFEMRCCCILEFQNCWWLWFQVLVFSSWDMLSVDVLWCLCHWSALSNCLFHILLANFSWLLHHVWASFSIWAAYYCCFWLYLLPDSCWVQGCCTLLHCESLDYKKPHSVAVVENFMLKLFNSVFILNVMS